MIDASDQGAHQKQRVNMAVMRTISRTNNLWANPEPILLMQSGQAFQNESDHSDAPVDGRASTALLHLVFAQTNRQATGLL